MSNLATADEGFLRMNQDLDNAVATVVADIDTLNQTVAGIQQTISDTGVDASDAVSKDDFQAAFTDLNSRFRRSDIAHGEYRINSVASKH